MGQFGFFDADRRLAVITAKGDPLEMIARVVPFESFRAEIEAAVLTPVSEKKSSGGRKPIDVMVMFRMLVLQSLYNLSDEQVEYQVRDRLSFTRFLGLGIEEGERSEPVRLRSVTIMHALSKGQVECKMMSGEGLFSLRTPGFESDQAEHIEPPHRHAVRPSARATPAEILAAAACSPRRSPNANRLWCTISTKSPELPAATRADFDPNGFRSSSPTTPAMQSVSEMCRNEVDESAPLVLPTPLALATAIAKPTPHPSQDNGRPPVSGERPRNSQTAGRAMRYQSRSSSNSLGESIANRSVTGRASRLEDEGVNNLHLKTAAPR